MKKNLLLFILIFSACVVTAQKLAERVDEVQSITSWQWLNQFNNAQRNGSKFWIANPELQLDSIVDVNGPMGSGQKFTFGYNLSGLSESVVVSNRDSLNDNWLNIKRHTTQYNADGFIVSVLTENATDRDDSVFEEWSLVTYTYGGNGLLQLRTTELNFGRGFSASERIVYTYNELDQLESELLQMEDSGNWLNSMLKEYTYDVNGHLETSTRNYSSGDSWMPNFRETYEYTEQGVLLSYTSARASFFDHSWMNGEHIRYEYSEQGDLLVERPYSGDYATESWALELYGTATVYDYVAGVLSRAEKASCYDDGSCYGEAYNVQVSDIAMETIVGAHNMLYNMTLFGVKDLSGLVIANLSTETIGGEVWEESFNRTIYYSDYLPLSTLVTEQEKELVYVNNRTIFLEEEQMVSVYSITGGVIFTGVASRIEIGSAGVYVLRTTRGTHKVVIQ